MITYEIAETIKTSILAMCVAVTVVALLYFVYDYNVKSIEIDRLHAELFDKAIEHNINPILVDCALNMALQDQVVCLAISEEGDKAKVQTILTESESYSEN